MTTWSAPTKTGATIQNPATGDDLVLLIGSGYKLEVADGYFLIIQSGSGTSETVWTFNSK